ncbi:glycosyltransferase family 32 protein [Parabacteroides sp.]
MNENNNIPKVIHYCWFGRNPLPPLAVKCIESWRKFLPDYEITEWNEDNFNVNIIPYTAQAYEVKKYAFVSDYARFWILYKYGGLYFDTDVEMIKPMDDIIAAGPFMGCENSYTLGATLNSLGIAPGLGLGVNQGLGLYREILDMYATLQFRRPDGRLNQTTVVKYTTDLLCSHGLYNTPEIQSCAGIRIYPKEFFCPIDYKTGKLTITPHTYLIHHYAASWHGRKEKTIDCLTKILGRKIVKNMANVYGFILRFF